MSAASTRRALGLSANCEGGRPPVDTVSAMGEMRPIFMSSSTRAAIVERASPVDFASSARVRGTPSRRSWNSWLTPDTPDAGSMVIFATFSIYPRVEALKSAGLLTGCRGPASRSAQKSARPGRGIRHVARPVGLANRCCSSTATTMMMPFATACTDEVEVVLDEDVGQRGEDEDAEDGAGDRAASADEQGAADDDRGDRVELVELAVRRGAGGGAAEDHDGRDAGAEARRSRRATWCDASR